MKSNQVENEKSTPTILLSNHSSEALFGADFSRSETSKEDREYNQLAIDMPQFMLSD